MEAPIATTSSEPRRSSRATKGQHSVSLTEELAAAAAVVAKVGTTKSATKTPAKKRRSTGITSRARESKKAKRELKTKFAVGENRDNDDDDDTDDSHDDTYDDTYDDDDSPVRCVCGLTKTDPNDKISLMAQCEMCNCWQHPECTMGIIDEKDVPEKYYCELCRPDLHTYYFETLKPKMEAEKAVNEKAEKAKAEKKGARKAEPKKTELKKGQTPSSERRKNQSMPTLARQASRKSPSDDADADADAEADADTEVVETPSPSAQAPVQSIKHRKPSNIPPVAVKYKKISDISDNVRKSVAKSLSAILEKAATSAITDGLLTLDLDTTAEAFVEHLVLEIEHALYDQYAMKSGKDVGHKYRDKFRTVSFNLKDAKNAHLRERVLSGELEPEHIVKMTPEELMNPELQRLAEAVRAESISQSILKKSDVPRIRRTHKGEEFVGDVDQLNPLADTMLEAAKQDSTQSVEGGEVGENKEGVEVAGASGGSPTELLRTESMLPPLANSPDSIDFDQVSNPDISFDRTPGANDGTVSGNKEATDDKRGSVSFDIDSALSMITSTAVPQSVTTTAIATEHSPPPPYSEMQPADDDIDRLINGDDFDHEGGDVDSYSPRLTGIEHIVWSGPVSMEGIEFKAKGVQVGGPLFDDTTRRWSDVLPHTIYIDGRISTDTASKYLLNVSSSKDFVALSLTSDDASSTEQFNKLFSYFHVRRRYGAIRKKSTYVKDAYLIPLSPADERPGYMDYIPALEIPRIVTKKVLVALFVINKTAFPARLSGSAGSGMATADEYDPTAASGIAQFLAPPPPALAPASMPSLPAEVAYFATSLSRQSPTSSIRPPAYPPAASASSSSTDIPAAAKSAIASLGFELGAREVEALEAILKNNADVAVNPALASDPMFLIHVVKTYQDQQNATL
ncbi:transcription factor S-II, central domain-containing protein [Limtongia smithiae]|uniref:transcription factor S-II, central domain-containing protein n=1 Tax=Limtongia smithiae TaxID=1125753 RepID=UPI0034CD9963